MKQSYVLFESCRIIKGFSRSLICDTQRQNYRFIGNELANFLILNNGKLISNILNNYSTEEEEIILSNLKILEENEIIFFTDIPELFPEMSLYFSEPQLVTNAIVEVNKRYSD